jgi:hypothetical protein
MKKNKSWQLKLILLIGLAILIIEAVFDVFEIAVGQYMTLINGLRPKTGRLWVEEDKDKAGIENVSAILQDIEMDSLSTRDISDIDQLQLALSVREKIIILKRNFIQIYRQLPPDVAQQWLEPERLYKLTRNKQWHSVLLSRDNDQLALLFLNGYNQLIMENHTSTTILKNFEQREKQSVLEKREPFYGRVVSAGLFLKAFDQMEESSQKKIVGNMYKLIDWGDDLKFVGISRYNEDGMVTIAFEIWQGTRADIEKTSVSEQIASQLVTKLNKLGRTPPLTAPLKTSVSYEDF